jgi:hypothetical protein
MPDVLVMAAIQLSHPVLLIVLMEADDAALHDCSLLASKRPAERRAQPVCSSQQLGDLIHLAFEAGISRPR